MISVLENIVNLWILAVCVVFSTLELFQIFVELHTVQLSYTCVDLLSCQVHTNEDIFRHFQWFNHLRLGVHEKSYPEFLETARFLKFISNLWKTMLVKTFTKGVYVFAVHSFSRMLITKFFYPKWLGQPTVKNLLPFAKFMKRPQTKLHGHAMRSSKVAR